MEPETESPNSGDHKLWNHEMLAPPATCLNNFLINESYLTVISQVEKYLYIIQVWSTNWSTLFTVKNKYWDVILYHKIEYWVNYRKQLWLYRYYNERKICINREVILTYEDWFQSNFIRHYYVWCNLQIPCSFI